MRERERAVIILCCVWPGLFVLVGVARAVGGDDGGVGGAGGDRGFGGVAEMGGFTSSSILLECQNDICTGNYS